MTVSLDNDSVLIGGSWLRRTTSEVIDPATEEAIGTAAVGSAADVDQAVSAATRAGSIWGRSSQSRRAHLLRSLHKELSAQRTTLIDTTVAEVGAPVAVAAAAHVDLAIELIDGFAQLADAQPPATRVGNSTLLRKPAGVVGCITPWNYPLYQLAAKIGAALAAGCTTVIKPAELTPLSTYLFCRAAQSAGIPDGVINLIPGAGAEVGAAIVAHPGVNVVSFTGSTMVGRGVAEVAGRQLKRACLELGGKSASIVLDDADLPTAVRSSVGAAMLNSGQTCSAWTRLVVPRSQFDDALTIASHHAAGIRVGDPRLPDTEMGPLISAKQRRSVLAAVENARKQGARLSADPLRDLPERGHFVNPIVISGVRRNDPIAQDEIFGPVLVVLAHDGDDDAVDIANDSRYGLAGAVWSADDDRAFGVAARLETGQVDINGARFNPVAPFGGWKESGLGRELGALGIDEFIEYTSVQR